MNTFFALLTTIAIPIPGRIVPSSLLADALHLFTTCVELDQDSKDSKVLGGCARMNFAKRSRLSGISESLSSPLFYAHTTHPFLVSLPRSFLFCTTCPQSQLLPLVYSTTLRRSTLIPQRQTNKQPKTRRIPVSQCNAHRLSVSSRLTI